MVESIKLSETSALVLRFLQGQVYHSKAVEDYLSHLDLSAGQSLHEACNAIWPEYAEVIFNRKHMILHHINETLAKNPSMQIISGAAGLDPLGLEVTQRHKGLDIFEIDREQMSIKAELISNPRLHLIEGDLADASSIIDKLKRAGWQQHRPTFLIMEGISYYLTPDILKNFVTAIKPQYAIFDHLWESGMNEAANIIGSKVFNLIRDYIKMDKIQRYDASSLSKLLGMKISNNWSLCAMERHRTGNNIHFLSDDFGWLDVTAFEAI